MLQPRKETQNSRGQLLHRLDFDLQKSPSGLSLTGTEDKWQQRASWMGSLGPGWSYLMAARPSETRSKVAVPCQTYGLIEQISLSLTLKLLPLWHRARSLALRTGAALWKSITTNVSNKVRGRSQAGRTHRGSEEWARTGWLQTEVSSILDEKLMPKLRTQAGWGWRACLPPSCLSQDNWSCKCEEALHRTKPSLALQFSHGAFNMCFPKPYPQINTLGIFLQSF